MELFALDIGNIQTKIKSSKTQKVLPSKFVNYEDLGNQKTSIRGSDLDIKEYKSNIDQDFSYAWGKDISQAKVKRFLDTIYFEDRYSKPNFKLLAAFAIGELAKDFPEATQSILNVNIVTGVPTNEFNEKDVKEIMKVLTGDHNIKINNTPVVVRVHEVKVLPQPVGSIYNELLDTEGNILNEEYEDETISVVDCGGGTVLIDTLKDMNLSETGRAQEEEGVHSLFDKIIADANKHQIIISNNEIEQILREQKGQYFFEPNKNESYEITDIVNKAIKKYTRDILNIVDSTLKGTSHIDTLFFTGGGSNLIDQKQVLKSYERAIFISNSEFANINGFYKFGLAVIESDQNVEEE